MKKLATLLMIVLALVALQFAVVPDSHAAPPAQGGSAQGGGGYGDGYGGGYGGGSHYRVRYGDTLFSIGRRFGVYPYYIAQVNGLANPNYIYAGQVLYIPSGGGWQQPCYGGGGGCSGGCNNQGGCYGSGYGYQQGYNNWCNQGCYGSGYGYDRTGYYYDGNYPNYQRYSHTCGYDYNCY